MFLCPLDQWHIYVGAVSIIEEEERLIFVGRDIFQEMFNKVHLTYFCVRPTRLGRRCLCARKCAFPKSSHSVFPLNMILEAI